MAALRIDHDRQHVEVDLHGYGVSHARTVARQKIREAWENGFQHITLIHGAAAVRRPGMAWSGGYGRIKWHLRDMFSRGKWRLYLYHGGSRKHRLDDGYMRLAVRPNPAPRLPAAWEPLPSARYSAPVESHGS